MSINRYWKRVDKYLAEQSENAWSYDFSSETSGHREQAMLSRKIFITLLKRTGWRVKTNQVNRLTAVYGQSESETEFGLDVMHNPSFERDFYSLTWIVKKALPISESEEVGYQEFTKVMKTYHSIGNFSLIPYHHSQAEPAPANSFQIKHRYLSEWWDLDLQLIKHDIQQGSLGTLAEAIGQDQVFNLYIKTNLLYFYVDCCYKVIEKRILGRDLKDISDKEWLDLIYNLDELIDEKESCAVISLIDPQENLIQKGFDELMEYKRERIRLTSSPELCTDLLRRINFLIEARGGQSLLCYGK